MTAKSGGPLSETQRTVLLEGIKPYRVSRDNKGMSYLEAFEVDAHLNRIFGFEGWDLEVEGPDLLFEDEPNTGRWTVAYKAKVRLTIRNPAGEFVTAKEDASTGDAQNQPSRADAHDLAIKAAVSGAIKRAARHLGDQFGLSLYGKGSLEPIVKRVLVYKSDTAPASKPEPETLPLSDEPSPASQLTERARAIADKAKG